MKTNRKYILPIIVLILALLGTSLVLAEDGELFRRNISKTPEGETEKAGMLMMMFYVPAQTAGGELTTVEYFDAGGASLGTRDFAKPLTAIYIDDIAHTEEVPVLAPDGGMTFGHHDTFVGHSLDDGATWKTVNLSQSADLSSFTLANGYEYPGDSFAAVQAVAGNRIMAAWLSRYCEGGSPLYTMDDDDSNATDIDYAGELQAEFGLTDLYIQDIWGVTGTQKSVDYTLQGFPEVGEIPYGCVWTARGILLPTTNDAGETIYDIAWMKAERLTSGVRDANRLEVDAIEGAGFAITWQEDPEGLRPGQGLGPGEGWSGAVVNAKTDIWYSFVGWDTFEQVDLDGDYNTFGYETLAEYAVRMETDDTLTTPKPAVHMAMPVRLTDNNMCKATASSDPTKISTAVYCYADIETNPASPDYGAIGDIIPTTYNAEAEYCTVEYPWVKPDTSVMQICQAPDGRVLNGRVGASRARIALYPYTNDNGTPEDTTDDFKSAWLVMAYEESKAMGDGTNDQDVDPIDIGKNIWFHSFDMFHPDLVAQGGMLNQPSAYNPETGVAADEGEFLTTLDEFGYTVFETEIARRFSLVAQSASAALNSESKTTAFLIYKQGILNQGGPADIFARRIVLPATFNAGSQNPYAYEYMACTEWVDWSSVSDPDGHPVVLNAAGQNPNYLQGVCLSPAINVSGTTNDQCYETASELGEDPSTDCAAVFPWDGDDVVDKFPKITYWQQYEGNLDDQSWENPFDVAKGHRGFLDGDFLMMLYAWSPNWKANSVGNDHYNLYVRRSFDGGQTWTTTPASTPDIAGDIDWGGVGIGNDPENPVCENYRQSDGSITTECYTYAAGEFEQARNVSQLLGTRVTVLDPRYTPTGGLKKLVVTDYLDLGYTILAEDAVRDSSKFFLVYETGDNTTAAEGEPTPLDLFYSRATAYGDVYDWVMKTTTNGTASLTWDWLENKEDDLSGEAAMTANPSGNFVYVDWNQWQEDEFEHIFNSDVWFRRLMYVDDLFPVFTPPTIEPVVPPGAPVASILYVSSTAVDYSDDYLTLIGTAEDSDHIGEGIVEYQWVSSIDGVVGHDRIMNIPPRTLSNGFHSFTFRAKDGEGNWSNSVTVNVLIAETIYTVNLPFARR